MKKLAILFLLCGSLWAQTIHTATEELPNNFTALNTFTLLGLPHYTVATAPPALTLWQTVVFTDGLTGSDCATGGGSTPSLCTWNGSGWVSIGGGGGGAGTVNASTTGAFGQYLANGAVISGSPTFSENSGTAVYLGMNGFLGTQMATNGPGSGGHSFTCGTIPANPGSGIFGITVPATCTGNFWLILPDIQTTDGLCLKQTAHTTNSVTTQWISCSATIAVGYVWPITVKTTNYNISTADFSSTSQSGTWFNIAGSNSATFKLPSPPPGAGSCLLISDAGSGTATMDSNSLLIDTTATTTTAMTMSRYQATEFCSDGTNYYSRGINSRLAGTGVTSVTGDGLFTNNAASTGGVTLTKPNQSANCVIAGPASGGAAAPTCRPLVAADLPTGGPYIVDGFGVTTGLSWAAGTDYYLTGNISVLPTTSSLVGTIEPFCSKIYGISVGLSAAAGTGNTFTFTVRDGTTTTDTTSSCSITATNFTCTDTSDQPAWTAGDGMVVHAKCTGTCGIAQPQPTVRVYCR